MSLALLAARARKNHSYVPISGVTATPNPSSVTVFKIGTGQPTTWNVSGSIAITNTGGLPSKTYTTTWISGAVMTVTNGTTANPTIAAVCNRAQTLTSVYRFTVSDGVTSNHVDVTVSRFYNWESGA